MLIPPSLLLILYGVLTEQSIGDLFIAGVIPGLILAVLFALCAIAMARFMPGFTGEPHTADIPALGLSEILFKALPIALLILLVLGGIYGGLFTPVEAGAIGAIGALVLGLAKRTLDWASLWRVLVETGLVTASVCFLIIAAQMYSRMLAFSGVPAGFGNYVVDADLSITMILLAYLAVIIVMGMILDSSSILLILVPLMLPVLAPYDVDLIWFGIVTIIAVEIGLLTPPFGISVYVIKSVIEDPDVKLGDIFLGAAPFAAMMLIALALVFIFPQLATALI
ncbi:TRAP transporter large permease subunit [Hoeflea alexandrii]|nr:TRAP transporter large permease subunit [Hoeflea alexandrii]